MRVFQQRYEFSIRTILSALKIYGKATWTCCRSLRAWLSLLVAVGLPLLSAITGTTHDKIARQGVAPRNQIEELDPEAPKTILQLQPFRQKKSLEIRSRGGREGRATLVNLNPAINAWYLLRVSWKDGTPVLTYHLENPKPHSQRFVLDENYPSGLVVVEGNDRCPCDLFGADPLNALDQAKNSQLIYAPLCQRRLYLRNSTKGHRSSLEAVAEFFRDEVWRGEKIIVLVHHLLSDAHRETGEIETQAEAAGGGGRERSGYPLSARIDPRFGSQLVRSGNLGIALDSPEGNGMPPGTWCPASGNPGIYVSMIQPNLIDRQILQSHKALVNNLDRVEASALCYLIAFDLDQFELGYALGTGHPRVGWSDRVLDQIKDGTLPGPDGIQSIAPLVSTGLVRPEQARRTVASFTGGFKRAHGAFKYGELALENYGSHYGFIEEGVVFSKLQPGLATIFVLDDGLIDMKTWSDEDQGYLPRIKHARQNGVAIIDFDRDSKSPVPGRLVGRWGPGNWSGSEDDRQRTMRAGVALQMSGGKRFLIYAWFSDATPSAMARVFQAYQCHYAMLLDMNALEHTYLAVYRRSGSNLLVDHLVKGMSQLEMSASGEVVPRFLGYADNRDFFYLMRRNIEEVNP